VTDKSSAQGQILDELEHLVDHVPNEEGPALMGELERLKCRLLVRLTGASRTAAAPPPVPQSSERLLAVKETAELLGVKPRWVYRHAHEIAARVDLPGSTMRFSKRKLEKWLAQRTP